MSDIYLKELEKKDSTLTLKSKLIRYLKFYLIPGARDPKFTAIEYEIGKIKSKRRVFRRIFTPLTIIGFGIIYFIVFLAVFSPWLSEYPLQELSLPYYPPDGVAFQPPSPEHLLGTTKYGYDLIGRIIWGSRTAVTAALLPVLIAVGSGMIIGTMSAYFGGKVDYIIMRFCDLMFAFPILIIVIVLAPLVGKDIYTILLIYGLLSIPAFIRFMRSIVLQVREMVYVRAATVGGSNKLKLMFKHILPNAISPMIISFFHTMAGAIIAFAGIGFLGLTQGASYADWGTDLNWAKARFSAFWAAIWPGFFIGITAIGFIFIGDGLRDALDPRLHI